MKIRKQTKFWTTRDKRKIRICDMHDTHLVNTINMLRRNAAAECAATSIFYAITPGPTADGAQMCFEQEQNRAWDATWENYIDKEAIHAPLLLDFERQELDPDLLKEPPDGQAMATAKLLKAFKE